MVVAHLALSSRLIHRVLNWLLTALGSLRRSSLTLAPPRRVRAFQTTTRKLVKLICAQDPDELEKLVLRAVRGFYKYVLLGPAVYLLSAGLL